MFYSLPIEIQSHIYSYDATWYDYYKETVMLQLIIRTWKRFYKTVLHQTIFNDVCLRDEYEVMIFYN